MNKITEQKQMNEHWIVYAIYDMSLTIMTAALCNVIAMIIIEIIFN